MNVLIAVKSCERDISKGYNQTIRDTWGRFVKGAALKFFVGRCTVPLKADEVRVGAPDDYWSLPEKTCAILRWSARPTPGIGLSRPGYDFVYLCDTDTFVRPELLLKSGFEAFDLVGLFYPRVPNGQKDAEGFYAWPSGGGGYWLSAKAAAIIAAHHDHTDWAEDRMIGQILGPHIASGMLKVSSRRDYGEPTGNMQNLITAHFCAHGMQREYDPEWMRRLYKKFYQGGR